LDFNEKINLCILIVLFTYPFRVPAESGVIFFACETPV
jgi:hypothetical protein